MVKKFDREKMLHRMLEDIAATTFVMEQWDEQDAETDILQDPRIITALQRLNTVTRSYIPGTREHGAVPIDDQILELFKREPTQPGADTIAKRLGRGAACVRAALKALVTDGVIESVGNGRNRHYRVAPNFVL